jgi:hypothetical protein
MRAKTNNKALFSELEKIHDAWSEVEEKEAQYGQDED